MKPTPIEYAKMLERLLKKSSIEEVANKTNKTVPWIKEKLQLLKLIPELATRVDTYKITLKEAYELSELTIDEQYKKVMK